MGMLDYLPFFTCFRSTCSGPVARWPPPPPTPDELIVMEVLEVVITLLAGSLELPITC